MGPVLGADREDKRSMRRNYRRTLIACYLGFITQAISANFAPLLFLKFHTDYGISLGRIALIPTVFFLTQLIVDVFIRFFGTEMPPMGMFVVLVLTTTIISNFVTNSTAVIIVLPIAISICSSLGYSLIPFALGIVYAANLACCTPIAHAQVSMTLVAGYRFSDYIKYNGIQALITNVLIIILTPLFFPF